MQDRSGSDASTVRHFGDRHPKEGSLREIPSFFPHPPLPGFLDPPRRSRTDERSLRENSCAVRERTALSFLTVRSLPLGGSLDLQGGNARMNGRFARISARLGSARRSSSSPSVRSLFWEDHVPRPSRHFGRLNRVWDPSEKLKALTKPEPV